MPLVQLLTKLNWIMSAIRDTLQVRFKRKPHVIGMHLRSVSGSAVHLAGPVGRWASGGVAGALWVTEHHSELLARW